jgi:hypothetical protein
LARNIEPTLLPDLDELAIALKNTPPAVHVKRPGCGPAMMQSGSAQTKTPPQRGLFANLSGISQVGTKAHLTANGACRMPFTNSVRPPFRDFLRSVTHILGMTLNKVQISLFRIPVSFHDLRSHAAVVDMPYFNLALVVLVRKQFEFELEGLPHHRITGADYPDTMIADIVNQTRKAGAVISQFSPAADRNAGLATQFTGIH